MIVDVFSSIDSYNDFEARADSEQLEQFRVRDFSSMQTELAQAFRETNGMVLRFVPVVARFAALRWQCYSRTPSRVFSGLTQALEARLRDVYRRADFDQVLKVAGQKLVTQHSVILAPEWREDFGVRLRSYAPFEFEVELGDNLLEDDLRHAKSVTLRVPVQRVSDGLNGTVRFGRRVYTKTEAYTEIAEGRKVGLFNADPSDLSNPFGFIPLLGLRLAEPPAGWWTPRLPTDLLALQVAVNLSLTDLDHIARSQCYAERVLIGPGASTALSKERVVGPTKVVSFDEENLDYQVHNTQPAIDRYIQQLEFAVKLFERYSGLPAGALTESTGITGEAKLVELQDSEREKLDVEAVARQAEQGLAALLVDMLNAHPRSLVRMPRPSVDVVYNYAHHKSNDLQAEQARRLRHGALAGSVIEDIREELGLGSDAEAVEVAERRLRWLREYTPSEEEQGIDKIRTLPS